ncbi:hypothetical protein QBC37DRAFT_286210 [Rhypophila decipiens]|uniref:Plasma membrane proteolipid 3 n=1 Tax=Rhypophila decipiens TaxID=261697 RepID=A0AAN6Y729_9PEZI|nr:hypothetical protein QBC37DRAFT_286210 [Rhypophila decipiens]
MPRGSQPIASTIFVILVTIIFPPLGVACIAGFGPDCLVNFVLYLFGGIPAYIHAAYIEYVYFSRRDRSRWGILEDNWMPGIFSERVQSGGIRL